MTGFDRVAAALEHKEPDRVPLDFGAAEVAAINIHTMRRLRRFLGMSEDVTLQDIVAQTVKMQNDLIERLKVDVKIVAPQAPANPNLAEVRRTVLHEVGHHFGMNERQLHELGYG